MPRISVAQLRLNMDLRKQMFLLREKTLSTTRTGSSLLRVVLADRSGTVAGVMFDVPTGVADQLVVGRGVEISGRVSEYRQQTQISMDRIVPSELSDLSAFLPVARRPQEEMTQEFDALIASVENPQLVQLLTAIFLEDQDTYKAFVSAPAAKYNHHACVGGLLEHTLSVARLVLTATDLYVELDRDTAIAAALLHDLGKIDAYDPLSFDITESGTMWGHLYQGGSRVERAMDAIEGFDPELKLRLLHAVLAHHGRLEYGSPVLPMTLEAIVVFQADQMDSSARGALDHLDRAGGEAGPFTDRSFMHDTKLYRGSTEDSPPAQPSLW